MSTGTPIGLCVALLFGCADGAQSDTEAPTVPSPDGSAASDGDSVHSAETADASPELSVPVVPPDPGGVTVLAGDASRGYFDGPAAMARFQGVTALCRSGDALYLSDTFAGTLRKVDLATGTTTTLAGRAGRLALSDGLAAEARFASPRGIACLTDGLLVADSGALRKVAFDGFTTTVAGAPGSPGFADGDAAEARIGYLIHAMAVHADGRVFFSDRTNDALRVVDPATGTVTTLVDGLAGPGGIALDPSKPNLVYVADTFADRVVSFDLEDGELVELALDPPPDSPQALAFDAATLWVAGFGPELWQYSVRGRGTRLSSEFPGTFASMVHVAASEAGEGGLIYAALELEALRRVGLTSRSDTLVAGPEFAAGPLDGPVASARFGLLSGVASYDTSLFIADELGLRHLDDGVVDTISADVLREDDAPLPATAVMVEGERLWVSLDAAAGGDAPGRVVVLGLASVMTPGASPEVVSVFDSLSRPAGLVVGPSGVLVAERGAHRVTLLAQGEALPFAGAGTRGTVDGTLAAARFDTPHALAWDQERGQLWVGQATGHLRLVEPAADRVTTVLRPGDPSDGTLDLARLGRPLGLVMWKDLYILDADPGGLRRLVLDGDAPVRLETLVGGVLGGGLPQGASTTLADAVLGSASAGAVVGQDFVVVAERAVYRVDLGDLLVDGGTGGPELGPCDFELRLGTGTDRFAPLGDTLLLERGAQGLQHILLALEADEVPAGFHVTTAALYSVASTEAPRAKMALTLPWQAGWASRVLFVIEDPARVVDIPLELVATVRGPNGLGCGRAPVVVRWAP